MRDKAQIDNRGERKN